MFWGWNFFNSNPRTVLGLGLKSTNVLVLWGLQHDPEYRLLKNMHNAHLLCVQNIFGKEPVAKKFKHPSIFLL